MGSCRRPATTLVLVLLLHLYYAPRWAFSLSFSLNFSDPSAGSSVDLDGDASISPPRLELTSFATNLLSSVGRASYARKVPLWNGATGEMASFTTSFSFQITPQKDSSGEGMAFFLGHFPSEIPPQSGGGGLGLLPAFTNGTGPTRMVAVEFDTLGNSYYGGISKNHVAIDVNSMVSTASTPITATPGKNLTSSYVMKATVTYHNLSKLLAVDLLIDGALFQVNTTVDLSAQLPEEVAVGFSAATGNASELHRVLSWSFSSTLPPLPTRNNNHKKLVHKHIFWSPCVVHTLNLIFKDLAGKFPWMIQTCEEGKEIGSYFRDHQHCQALFRDNSKLDLLRVAKTRFASNYIVLRRLSDVREALATTVVTTRWKDLLKACDPQGRAKATAIAQSINSERFWDNVDAFLAMTKPLFMVIKFSDGEGPKIGDVYERMDNMLGEIQDVVTKEDNPRKEDWPVINEIVIKRWGKMNWTLHCLAFALSPKYYDHAYLATPAPGGVTRKAPNEDKEVMVAVIDSLKRIAEDGAEHKLLREEFNTFITKKGIFALAAVQADAVTMNAIDWWFNYGSETPHLAEVAKKVLSQPISSSSAERNWSTYSYIHNVKRNRMNTKTADKLVYVHSNERLKRRFSESYKEGPHYKWDVDPENDLLEESNLRLEKMRWEGLEGDNDNPTFEDAPEPPRKIQKTRK